MSQYTRFFSKVLLWLNRWSVDVALGASLAYAWLTVYYHREVSLLAVITVFCAVLAWYHLDHLLDSYILKATTPRRTFYVFYRHVLQVSVPINFLIAGITSFYLPTSTWIKGWMLVVVMMLYFFLIFSRPKLFFFKEFSVALIYSVAVHLEVIDMDWSYIGQTVVSYFMLAFSNLLLFDYFECMEEKKEVTDEVYEKWLYGTLVAQGIVGFFVFQTTISSMRITIQGLFLIAHLAFIVFWKRKTFFLRGEKFRFLGDEIFVLLPTVGLCLAIVS